MQPGPKARVMRAAEQGPPLQGRAPESGRGIFAGITAGAEGQRMAQAATQENAQEQLGTVSPSRVAETVTTPAVVAASPIPARDAENKK